MDGPPIKPATIEPPVGVDREAFTLAYLAVHESECPACGYNLHALTVARCPECGRPLEVRLVTQARLSWAWVALLTTSAFGAGFGMLLLPAVLKRGLPDHGDAWLNIFLGDMPFALIVFLTRKWFSRLGSVAQWAIAIPIAIFNVIIFGALLWRMV